MAGQEVGYLRVCRGYWPGLLIIASPLAFRCVWSLVQGLILLTGPKVQIPHDDHALVSHTKAGVGVLWVYERYAIRLRQSISFFDG